MDRQVLHLNVANFMAAVEALRDPTLRGEPFIIAPPHNRRAVIIDVSEAAFREGLRRGMPLAPLGNRLRGMRLLEPDYPCYHRAESHLYKMALSLAPRVERLDGGNLFCDITGTTRLFGAAADHALRIRREISATLGFHPVTGLASNRLVSKVATRVVKPEGFVTVPWGDEEGFLCHQEISLLPGIGEKLSERLHVLGVEELGELACLPDEALAAALGKRGPRLRDAARGIDFTPVNTASEAERRIREEVLLESDTNERHELAAHLFGLAEETGCRLRREGMTAGRVDVSLTYTDGIRTAGGTRLASPSWCDRDFFDAATDIMVRIRQRRVRVRRLSLSLGDLRGGSLQLDLFTPPERLRRESLQQAIDAIRNRYGSGAIRAGYSLRGATHA